MEEQLASLGQGEAPSTTAYQREVGDQRKKKVVSRAIEELKDKMTMYVEQLLDQTFSDKKGVQLASLEETRLNFENFKVETASRRVFTELLNYFGERDVTNEQII
jgi:hypothetical protein